MSLVTVKDVWKRYEIPHQKGNTILERIASAFQMLEGERFSYEELWALRNVNFTLDRGDSIGIIGENGSGKSTLLKIIAGIIVPTKGEVAVTGKIAPILALGVGFQGELSVEDNIRMYASILGLRNIEARAKTPTILKFAELESFKDTKLKYLSSGMQMRLAFSIAVETDPDVFLIDEGLAVGDLDFQRKCVEKFKEFQENRRSIVLVSHSLGLVRDFCPRALLLSKGQVVMQGNTSEVVARYVQLHSPSGS